MVFCPLHKYIKNHEPIEDKRGNYLFKTQIITRKDHCYQERLRKTFPNLEREMGQRSSDVYYLFSIT